MPNQRAANIQVTTIAIDKGLVKQLDKLAKMSDRSRNKVIQLVLSNYIPRYIEQNIDPSKQIDGPYRGL